MSERVSQIDYSNVKCFFLFQKYIENLNLAHFQRDLWHFACDQMLHHTRRKEFEKGSCSSKWRCKTGANERGWVSLLSQLPRIPAMTAVNLKSVKVRIFMITRRKLPYFATPSFRSKFTLELCSLLLHFSSSSSSSF